jgi:hypothetical protein
MKFPFQQREYSKKDPILSFTKFDYLKICLGEKNFNIPERKIK